MKKLDFKNGCACQELKAGKKIKAKDGMVAKIRGAYMSETGIVLRIKEDDGRNFERNLVFTDADEIE